MSSKNEMTILYAVACKVFEEATAATLGSTCSTVISYHLGRKFNKDPFEVFVDDPKSFYGGLQEVFGPGAESMLNLVGTCLAKKYNVDCNAEEFAKSVIKGDESSKAKLKEILSTIVRQNNIMEIDHRQ